MWTSFRYKMVNVFELYILKTGILSEMSVQYTQTTTYFSIFLRFLETLSSNDVKKAMLILQIIRMMRELKHFLNI